MKYVLECSCDSDDFDYNEGKFICCECGNELTEEKAGSYLIALEEE